MFPRVQADPLSWTEDSNGTGPGDTTLVSA
jgi:hypothetical protein